MLKHWHSIKRKTLLTENYYLDLVLTILMKITLLLWLYINSDVLENTILIEIKRIEPLLI